ncbi:Rod shape-determining protein MreC [hydrothermal vent metagenome]|uniref:Cell shape-determining protein MreC n=1 Tax=hydrothermal vent metagenome TaxID=652676 RepID=A0A3B1D8G6_9ZZZZ
MIYLASFAKKGATLFVLLSIVVFIFSPETQKKPLKLLSLPVGTSVYYLQVASNGLFDGIFEIWEGYIDLMDVREENLNLLHRIDRLTLENSRLREKEILTDRLKALLDYREHADVGMVSAEVIGRDPSQWFDTIILNKGSVDGIAVDMGVVTPMGVVGKVIHVAPRYAQVLLVSDFNSAIGARVQRTRDEGIIQGVNTDSLQLKYLSHDSKVSVGDLLVTSGMEGSFIKGLNIGRVEDLERRDGEMFLKIKTTVAVDLSKVEEVLIIRSIQDEQ